MQTIHLQNEVHEAIAKALLPHDHRYCMVTYEEFTVIFSRGRIGVPYDWTVRHERFGQLRTNIPADTLAEAKAEAAEWIAKWITNDLNA
jgi:hypothetical protein